MSSMLVDGDTIRLLGQPSMLWVRGSAPEYLAGVAIDPHGNASPIRVPLSSTDTSIARFVPYVATSDGVAALVLAPPTRGAGQSTTDTSGVLVSVPGNVRARRRHEIVPLASFQWRRFTTAVSSGRAAEHVLAVVPVRRWGVPDAIQVSQYREGGDVSVDTLRVKDSSLRLGGMLAVSHSASTALVATIGYDMNNGNTHVLVSMRHSMGAWEPLTVVNGTDGVHFVATAVRGDRAALAWRASAQGGSSGDVLGMGWSGPEAGAWVMQQTAEAVHGNVTVAVLHDSTLVASAWSRTGDSLVVVASGASSLAVWRLGPSAAIGQVSLHPMRNGSLRVIINSATI
jgi:hypothetical protein